MGPRKMQEDIDFHPNASEISLPFFVTILTTATSPLPLQLSRLQIQSPEAARAVLSQA